MDPESVCLIKGPPSMAMHDMHNMDNVGNMGIGLTRINFCMTQINFLSDGQTSFFSQLKHQLNHEYCILDFTSIAALSRTSHAMRKECYSIWKALADSKILRSLPIGPYLPQDKDLALVFSQALNPAYQGILPIELLKSVLRPICATDAKFIENLFLDCAVGGHVQHVRVLLDLGMIHTQPRNKHGDTALMLAVRSYQPRVTQMILNHFKQDFGVQYLLENENNFGHTALTIAKDRFYDAQTNLWLFDTSLANAEQLFALTNKRERFKWKLYKTQLACIRCVSCVISVDTCGNWTNCHPDKNNFFHSNSLWWKTRFRTAECCCCPCCFCFDCFGYQACAESWDRCDQYCNRCCEVSPCCDEP